jgi:hypothetical protein
MADARECAFDDGCVELMGRKSHGLATRIGDAIVAVEKSACFFANVSLRREFFDPRFDCTDVVDRDAKVADAGFFRLAALLEDRDIVKAVGDRDISVVGTAELAHLKIGGVKVCQGFGLLADDGQITNL